MKEILIFACDDCGHIYEQYERMNCPKCNSTEYEIIDVEVDNDI